MSSSETVEVGGVTIQAWREYQSGEIGWTQFTEAVVDVLNRATKPTADEKETPMKIEPGVYATDSGAWHTAIVTTPMHFVGLGSVLVCNGERCRSLHYHPNGIIDDSHTQLGHVVTLTHRISDLPDAREHDPTPSPQAQAAAEEIGHYIVNRYGTSFGEIGRADIAASVHKHTRCEKRDAVVEAAKVLDDTESGTAERSDAMIRLRYAITNLEADDE